MGNYIPGTKEERLEMLKAIGLSSPEELYADVPKEVLLSSLSLPEGKSEYEVSEEIRRLSGENTAFSAVYRGAGAYRHYIPSIVKTITAKEEFLTAYTPYQAEISQGVLQSIFEYQTQICELTGMDVSNASVYDGASAAAEAVLMTVDNRKKKNVVVSEGLHPDTLAVIRTYCEARGVPVRTVPLSDCATDPDALKDAIDPETACVAIQNPNYYGIIEEMDALTAICHEKGAKIAAVVNPISLGLIKTPGEYGADIACGEGQPLGLPLSFGGPYLGFMAARKDLMRKLPGRIVGETTDHQGRRAFVLTLQAREQHIRREKASSNICSNEALCAMTASVYLAAMGPAGIRQAAVNSAAHAHYLAECLSKIEGFALKTDRPYFHEFLMSCPVDPEALLGVLSREGILGGLPVGKDILWCATELNSKKEIDRTVLAVRTAIKEVSGK